MHSSVHNGKVWMAERREEPVLLSCTDVLRLFEFEGYEKLEKAAKSGSCEHSYGKREQALEAISNNDISHFLSGKELLCNITRKVLSRISYGSVFM